MAALRSAHQHGSVPVLVTHVLPVDVARGAQTYARALRDLLDRPEARHRIVVLFRSGPGPLQADDVLDVPSGRWRAVGLDARAVWRLRATLARARPDVVVAHGGEALKYAALASRRPQRLVYYKIGTAVRMANPARRALYRVLAKRADVVAAVSEDAAAAARRELGVAVGRLRVVPNGRDPAAFPPRSRPPSDRARLIFVGHLTRSKRPELFLEVVSELRRRGVDVEAVVVGDGPLFDRIRDAAGEGVEVLGRREDVPALLVGSDVLVFTSVPEGEGMPGVLIEAGLAGLPVVTTDVPGARTVVEDGVTGSVVGVHERDALVDAVVALARDPALRARMGAAARERCTRELTVAASAERWQRLFDSLG